MTPDALILAAAWTPTGVPPGRASLGLAVLFAGQWFVIPALAKCLVQMFRPVGAVARRPGRDARRRFSSFPPPARGRVDPPGPAPPIHETPVMGGTP